MINFNKFPGKQYGVFIQNETGHYTILEEFILNEIIRLGFEPIAIINDPSLVPYLDKKGCENIMITDKAIKDYTLFISDMLLFLNCIKDKERHKDIPVEIMDVNTYNTTLILHPWQFEVKTDLNITELARESALFCHGGAPCLDRVKYNITLPQGYIYEIFPEFINVKKSVAVENMLKKTEIFTLRKHLESNRHLIFPTELRELSL